MGTIRRPSLGVSVSLGTPYDARKDKFLSVPTMVEEVTANFTSVNWQESSYIALCDNDTQQTKFKALSLGPQLASSYLAGWVDVEGPGLFLQSTNTANNDNSYFAFHYAKSTVVQNLSLSEVVVRETFENTQLDPTTTHIVSQILWGAGCSVTARGNIQDRGMRDDVQENFSRATQRVHNFEWQDMDFKKVLMVVDEALDPILQFECRSDILSPPDQCLTTLPEIKQQLEIVYELSRQGYDRAKPLGYMLTPLSTLRSRSDFFQSPCQEIEQMDQRQFWQMVELFDNFRKARICLEEHSQKIKKHRSAIPAQHIVDVHDAIQNVTDAQSDFDKQFPSLLSSVRDGRQSFSDVEDFIRQHSAGASSPVQILTILKDFSDKIDLIEQLTDRGAMYCPHQQLNQQSLNNCFVFHFSKSAMNQSTWQSNIDLVMRYLADQMLVFAVDYDADGTSLDKPRLTEYKNGKIRTQDVIEQRKYDESLSFTRFDNGSLDTFMRDPPAQRKPVCIPCPGRACGQQVREWVCHRCRVKVDFGVVDNFFYCECGRARLESASFNCQQGHGPSFDRYHVRELQVHLRNLPSPPEINLLLLGETGVGKSTFINAFINYLSFQKLDDALEAKHLNHIIPCSFSTQSEDSYGRLVQNEVKIGYDQDELDGSRGQSATQQATTYAVNFGGGLIRLIDTPGIGDTRGKDMDQENMRNILRVLRNYDQLHGILILLKPNNARLTIMFKFCVKELLTQLHRNAAENMVFGFTNTRGSNYQPGDTFQPLQTLLEDYNDVIPGLFKDTVYCFDSESFRYLAARHQGVDMGNIEDYRRSWDHSAAEARRMVQYFKSKTPHEVRSTVSLNETRYLISELVQPMAQISTAIADTVKKSEEQIKDLQDTKLHGKELSKKLMMTKTVIDSRPLAMPRTVCSNSECCKYTTDESSGGQSYTLFKSLCHDPCYLKDVPPNVVGAKEIPPCAAFSGKPDCLKCGHNWKEHQHITIEYVERTETTTDPTVQKALAQNSDATSAKQAQIDALKRLIRELQEEHRLIQKSQAQFSHYLKKHTITHYNDATVEYYEHLIKDEKSKVSFGGDRTRLRQLEQDKNAYENFVNAMESGRHSDRQAAALDENGVYQLVKRLYSMKHYGKNLRDCAKKTGQAYAATFRERPYRVRLGGSIGPSFGRAWSVVRPRVSNPDPILAVKSASAMRPLRMPVIPKGANIVAPSIGDLASINQERRKPRKLSKLFSNKSAGIVQVQELEKPLERGASPHYEQESLEEDGDNVVPLPHLDTRPRLTSAAARDQFLDDDDQDADVNNPPPTYNQSLSFSGSVDPVSRSMPSVNAYDVNSSEFSPLRRSSSRWFESVKNKFISRK